MTRRRCSVVALCLVGAACQTLTDQPARFAAGDQLAQSQLRDTLHGVLNTQVRLAQDALVDSNLLIIELAPRRSLRNQPGLGRTMTRPMRFELVRHGRDCVLIDRRDDTRHLLPDVTCIEAATPDP